MFLENFVPNRTIISVIGSNSHLSINENIKSCFKQGMKDFLKMQQKNKHETIILTGGTDIGVSRLVGDAVSNEYFTYKSIRVIGITSLEKLTMKSKLLYASEEKTPIIVKRLTFTVDVSTFVPIFCSRNKS